jgi:hypothetical protein
LRALEQEIAALARHTAEERRHPYGNAAPQIHKLRSARLIFNPQSKGVLDGTYRLTQIVDCLRAYGIHAEVGLKTSGKVARVLAKAGALSAVVGKGIALTLPVEAVPSVPPLSGPQPPRLETDSHAHPNASALASSITTDQNHYHTAAGASEKNS